MSWWDCRRSSFPHAAKRSRSQWKTWWVRTTEPQCCYGSRSNLLATLWSTGWSDARFTKAWLQLQVESRWSREFLGKNSQSTRLERQLRAHATLPEELSPAPSIPTGWLTTSWNSNSKGTDSFLCPLWVPALAYTNPHRDTHKSTNKLLKNYQIELLILFPFSL